MPLKESYLSFYDYSSKNICLDIWDKIANGEWKNFDIDAFLYNNTLPCCNLHKSLPLYKNYYQIVPGTKWSQDHNSLKLDLYTPVYTEKTTLSDFLELSAKYFEQLKAKRIGVHLSGGLDSGLIIAILKHLNIPFVPIGLKSDTFEFRTERRIQEILLEWGEDGLLIDMHDVPFYSDLTSIPKHQIPDEHIKSVASTKMLAKAFAERGCDVVLSGQGGDSLLVDEVISIKSLKFNINDEFINHTNNSRYYEPLGLQLKSFFANRKIINFFSSIRLGQELDPKKLWIRFWAKKILPIELSEFSYSADFFGLSMQGLENARPTIKLLFEEAYDISHLANFSPKNVKRFLKQDVFSFEFNNYINYCGLISVACWYHSLFNNE